MKRLQHLLEALAPTGDKPSLQIQDANVDLIAEGVKAGAKRSQFTEPGYRVVYHYDLRVDHVRIVFISDICVEEHDASNAAYCGMVYTDYMRSKEK